MKININMRRVITCERTIIINIRKSTFKTKKKSMLSCLYKCIYIHMKYIHSYKYIQYTSNIIYLI